VLKLVTGQPGGGKTSNELWNFLNAPEYQGRPKYCTPVNGFEPEKHGVKPIEHISSWQELPQGSVIFCDEVQDFCGTDLGKIEPEWVKQLARHRHHGYDFIFTTQSPMFLHPFVRKLVQPHVHYAKPFGMQIFRYQWESTQNDPLSKSAKAIGQRSRCNPNPEVFKLYTSTVLDTHKARPPYKILIIFAIFLSLAIGLTTFGFMRVKHIGQAEPVIEKTQTAPQSHPVTEAQTAVASSLQNAGAASKPVWTEETLKPRLPGQLFSAPVYDQLTTPTDFPRVAGCMASKARNTCSCYSQQGTPLDVPRSACEVFVAVGSFDPWLSGRRQQQTAQQSPKGQQVGQQPATQPVLGKSTIASDIRPERVASNSR